MAGVIITLIRQYFFVVSILQKVTIIRSDGGYYYKNTNGSTYYDNGQGSSYYTPPGGQSGKSSK